MNSTSDTKPAKDNKHTCREALWEKVSGQHEWDMVVIGGGITGAGIFRHAAKSGLKVLLIEQEDFAWGTSSRSSKMVHGGFRYIAQGDIQLTKEALHEREQMLKEVPGLVDREQFVFPLRRGRFPGRFSLGVLLKVYDLLAGVNDSNYLKNESLDKQVPGLDIVNLKGAISYSDAITDDTRLVMRVLQEGIDFGGTAINYVKAEDLEKNEKGDVEFLALRRKDTQAIHKVKANVFVNATGAWADKLMTSKEGDKKVRPLRGSHLVLSAEKFNLQNALTLVHPDDGRPIFMFPWYGRILLGTTDLDYPEDLDKEAGITKQESEYLLKVVNEFFPDSHCTKEDVISSFCGVRPVISSGKGVDPSKEKRGHSIWQQGNLISVSGGKLTIWRVIADEVMEKAASFFGGKAFNSEEKIFSSCDTHEQNEVLQSLEPDYKSRLEGRYGANLDAFLSSFSPATYLELEKYGFSLADCFWAIQNEQVLHLDDLMFRRTRLGLLQNDSVLEKDLLDYLAKHLDWNEEEKECERQRYQQIRKDYYSLPQ